MPVLLTIVAIVGAILTLIGHFTSLIPKYRCTKGRWTWWVTLIGISMMLIALLWYCFVYVI